MDRKSLQHMTSVDLKSQAWERFKGDLTTRLHQLRAENDNDLDEKQSAKLRGRISEIKSMLALDKPDPTKSGASEVDSDAP
jgi:hypothetical protein